MTVIVDNFNRASLGPNWDTPAGAVVGGGAAVEINVAQDAVRSTALDGGCSAVYDAVEFSSGQFSQVTMMDEMDDSGMDNSDYSLTMPWINAQPRSADNPQGILFFIQPYGISYPTYPPMGWGMQMTDPENNTLYLYGYFADAYGIVGSVIPAGTILRLERDSHNVVRAMIKVPTAGAFSLVVEADCPEDIVGGYPGLRIYAENDLDQGRAGEFIGGDFLPGNRRPGSFRNSRSSRFPATDGNLLGHRFMSASRFNKTLNRFS